MCAALLQEWLQGLRKQPLPVASQLLLRCAGQTSSAGALLVGHLKLLSQLFQAGELNRYNKAGDAKSVNYHFCLFVFPAHSIKYIPH